MRKKQARAVVLWVPLALAATACQYPYAYVYTPREFDRSAPEFRQIPLDLSAVTVCVRPFRSIDDQIKSLADQECQRFGKSAVDPQSGFGVCPILLASVVVFKCVPPTS